MNRRNKVSRQNKAELIYELMHSYINFQDIVYLFSYKYYFRIIFFQYLLWNNYFLQNIEYIMFNH